MILMFEDLDTYRIMQFVHLGGKVDRNVSKCCSILNIGRQILHHFCNIQANRDPSQ